MAFMKRTEKNNFIKTSKQIKKSYAMILLLRKVMDGKYATIDFSQMVKLLKQLFFVKALNNMKPSEQELKKYKILYK